MGIVSCAAALVDYHPGARSDEFNNSESYRGKQCRDFQST